MKESFDKNTRTKYKCLVCKHSWRNKTKKFHYPFSCPNCHKGCWDFGDNIKCFVCEKNILFPLIHHKDGIHKNNYFTNRLPICSICHLMVHRIDFRDLKTGSKSSLKRINYESIIRLRKLQEVLVK